MPARRIDAAFRHVGEHRRHQRVAEPARNLLGRMLDDEVVLAEHHVRTVLLRAAGRKDDGGLPGLDRVAHLGPCELLDEYGVGQFRSRRR